MNGWICLHRRLLEWEWYSDINATRLFLHCLLKANHKDKKWQGKVIPRGSFITGRNVLADETGLTVQQIRTALDKLKSTNEITIKATNKNSLVTVVNYGFYQDKQEEITSKPTNKPLNGQPSNNHNQQCNNINNKDLDQQKADPKFIERAFNFFWDHYGRKVGKEAAVKAFKKIMQSKTKTQVKELTEHIVGRRLALMEKFREQPESMKGFDVLHASTFLNNKRWEDEL